jgi:hypothetical protein
MKLAICDKRSKTIFATEITENTESASVRFFLCALGDLCGKIFCSENHKAAQQPLSS